MLTRYGQRNLIWIDLISPTPAEVRLLMQEFDVDPTIAQELLVPSFRQKVERRGDIIYVTLHFSALRGIGRRPEQEIDFIIGKHFLITTHYETNDPLHAFAKAFEVDSVLDQNQTQIHGGHLFVEMVGNLYRALIEECELLERRLIDIEERIFDGSTPHMVAEISQTGRIIHDFHQSLLPHREMLTSLEPVANRMFGSEFLYHLRNLEGVYNRLEQTLKNLRESLMELRETNNSLLSTKQNEIMKTLTVLTFIFFPLVFVGSILDLYLQYAVGGHAYIFWITIGAMALVALFCLVYFKRKGWL